jgi:diadenosine tetraphosphatase ApaH/serine/threonine PP2A family protein phosphatase
LSLLQTAAKVDASDFLEKIEQAMDALQAERKRGGIAGGKVSGGLIEILDLQNLVIVGDLHGDSHSFSRILDEINYEQFLADPMNKLIFLGDYVDRGTDSIGVLYSICYLKHVYPDSVVLMRGNHESPSEFQFSSHDLPYRIEERFGANGKAVYAKLLLMFKLLTLATIMPQKLLLVHGGLPTNDAAIDNYREAIATAQEDHITSRVFEELLWNDPRQVDRIPGWEPSRRGIGRHFGSGISSKWLQVSGAKVIVRGHEPCQGFKIDHDGMVLTLFSCEEAYPSFKAAYLKLNANQLSSVSDAKDLSKYIRFPK